EPSGANNMRGVMDEFAVYASALDGTKIGLLAQGASPVTFELPKLSPTMGVRLEGANLVISGTGGTPNAAFNVLKSPVLTQPLGSWAVAGSGNFDATGAFSITIAPPTNAAQHFYVIQSP
ncbi:MAG: hypothetical protein AB1813_11970, partial [Verrucomicrobiota bacterium]